MNSLANRQPPIPYSSSVNQISLIISKYINNFNFEMNESFGLAFFATQAGGAAAIGYRKLAIFFMDFDFHLNSINRKIK